MKIRYLFIAQFLAWAGFTLIDFIGRKTSIDYYFKRITSIDLKEVICLGVPIILTVLYFIRRKSLWNNEKIRPLKKRIIQFLMLIGTWLFVTIVSTIIISKLVFNDLWILSPYWWDDLYYPIYGFLLLVIPTGLVLVGELLILIVVKCSSYWRFHKS